MERQEENDMSKKYKECEDCNGTGHVGKMHYDIRMYSFVYDTLQGVSHCSKCKGTGKIEVTDIDPQEILNYLNTLGVGEFKNMDIFSDVTYACDGMSVYNTKTKYVYYKGCPALEKKYKYVGGEYFKTHKEALAYFKETFKPIENEDIKVLRELRDEFIYCECNNPREFEIIKTLNKAIAMLTDTNQQH